MTVTIPSNHRRSLSVSSYMLEESMDELERLLRSQEPNRVTRQIVPVYSDVERRVLLETIAQVRSANTEMFSSLDLQPTVTTEDQMVRGKLAHVWVVLQDSLSHSMHGYGTLPPQAAERIDRQVQPILEIVNHLIALAGQTNREQKGTH